MASAFAVHAQAPAKQFERALPLHRFEVSRQAQTDAEGYFQPAFAIGDDYFDGRDSRARVRRHLRIARQVGVKYLRCAFSWNGIEPEDGRYDFKFWDMLVEEAARAGVRIIPYVAYTPEWPRVRKSSSGSSHQEIRHCSPASCANSRNATRAGF